jgi:phenylalanyl-tRNA synthetase alpha chain
MNLDSLIKDFTDHYFQALQAAGNEDELEHVRLTYLSRQGKITELMGHLKGLSTEEKRIFGPRLNELKEHCLTAFQQKKQALAEQREALLLEEQMNFDVTAYRKQPQGSLHPYTRCIQMIEDIFISMGFAVVQGPEVETPFYNFEALNIPADHPARELHDTFWLTLPGYLLRTHTSSVQIRAMQERKPPFALCVPGRVYRHEATDATHDFVFMQLEGLVVDKHLSIADLLGTLKIFTQALFKSQSLTLRVRPSYFPFVEPGIEVDISCPFCTIGCSLCKKARWIELGGAGMVHPHVLSACGINPEEWSGFAWGFGIERLAMMLYDIQDVRLLKSEKVEFLKQF